MFVLSFALSVKQFSALAENTDAVRLPGRIILKSSTSTKMSLLRLSRGSSLNSLKKTAEVLPQENQLRHENAETSHDIIFQSLSEVVLRALETITLGSVSHRCEPACRGCGCFEVWFGLPGWGPVSSSHSGHGSQVRARSCKLSVLYIQQPN